MIQANKWTTEAFIKLSHRESDLCSSFPLVDGVVYVSGASIGQSVQHCIEHQYLAQFAIYEHLTR